MDRTKTESGAGDYYGHGNYAVHRVLEEWGLNYNLGAVVCYCARNGKKPGEDPIEGLKKAKDHLQFEIERLERQKKNPVDNVVYSPTNTTVTSRRTSYDD